MLKRIAILSVFLFSFVREGFAVGGNRSVKTIGIYTGLFSDPFPGLWSVGAKFNAMDFLQIYAGYGSLSGTATDGSGAFSMTSIGGGAKIFVPGWNFTPFAGFTYASGDATGTVNILGTDISGLTEPITYATFGLDYQGNSGINFGFGAHYMLAPDVLANVISIIPNLYLGWFF